MVDWIATVHPWMVATQCGWSSAQEMPGSLLPVSCQFFKHDSAHLCPANWSHVYVLHAVYVTDLRCAVLYCTVLWCAVQVILSLGLLVGCLCKCRSAFRAACGDHNCLQLPWAFTPLLAASVQPCSRT